MAAVKVSVSLDEADLEWLRKQASKRRKSLSAVLTETIRAARRERALDDVLRWLDAPKLTPEELDEFRREWSAE